MSKLQELTISEFKSLAGKMRSEVSNLARSRVLVVGDVGLDEYLSGEVKRISPEAPVPVLEVVSESSCAGLAGNVAQNIAALGGGVVLIGVVGEDNAAEHLAEILKKQNVKDIAFIKDSDRPTTRKVRAMTGQHHLVRMDFEAKKFLSSEAETKALKMISENIAKCTGLILQDYGKGMLSENLCQSAIEIAHKHGKKVLVDPYRTTPLKFYLGADLIKPNRDEAFILSGLQLDDLRLNNESIFEVARAIRTNTKTDQLVITSGKDGVFIFNNDGASRVPTLSQQVFDVTGAGDTFLSAFALTWFSGHSLNAAALVANAASGVVVGKIGSHPCTKEELVTALARFETQGPSA